MQKLLAASAVAALALLGAAAPAHAAQPEAAAQNSTAYWEALGYGECIKQEWPDGAQIVALPGLDWTMQATLLVMKAGSGPSSLDIVHYPYDDGYYYSHSTGKDISFSIYCVAPRSS
ncbi:hypothetical protein [Agrococcus sp. HG114]|uniref:hypothetical protein n=1 Tax=Agrococcus sp. HG114 TaxID=2969757 RepID=UPI00215B546C|nr:hypothetical protein [Agrococcus sp. HG114]MCR8670105.1 hypothetical protein [Agrococcus sp. HG114]